ncbi:MAG: Crp/Fnr family transcriptional regulator [Spirochaetaceae bacterium]|nr:MAG: Crp/Fnr family transcriptional regulator [Spirochaetaceae bacterium]
MNLEAFERFAVTYNPGDIIFCEFEPGDAFYLIQQGRVQITKIMGDIEKTVDVLQPGEIFGEMAILEEAPRSATALAAERVKCLEFNRANFEILMRGNPAIALKLLKLFTKRIYDQRRRFMILTLDDVQARVADVFLMLNEGTPHAPDESDERFFQTTPEDIAHWAGLSTDQTRHVLNHFVTQRRVEVLNDKIIVKNINEFVRFVASRRKQ